MNLSQVLQQSGVITSMARELNVDEGTARTAAGALLPAIVAGMGRQTTAQAGTSGLGGLGSILGGALGGGAGGGLLDQVLGQGPTTTQPGNDILGEIFGSKDVSRGVAEEVAGSTGIAPDLIKKMLPILAMAVVGYMMNQNRGASANDGAGGGLGGALGGALGGGAGGGMLGGALGGILGQVVSGMARR